jgi:tRNA pseudouridine38-40 synthase
MVRYAIKIAYDGRYFHGYARQPNVETVEGTLISTLIDHNIFSDPKTAIFRSASRTDKGVSSFGNVVAFDTNTPGYNSLTRCNKSMDHILIIGIKQVEPSFYPRYAKQRIYHYYLHKNNYDLNMINRITKLFIGTHNFTNFARVESKKNPIRTIENILVEETDTFFIIKFYAQTFLWNQIRRIVNVIDQFLKGKRSYEEVSRALLHPSEKLDFGVANAESLILFEVCYDFHFDCIVQTESFEQFKRVILSSF